MTFLENLLAAAPRVLLFLAIVVIGWLIARLLLTVVAKLLSRVGFDRAAERGGMDRWLGSYSASRLTARIVYYAVLLLTLQFAFSVFGPNPITEIIDLIVGFLPRLFIAVVIVVIAAAIGSAVRDVVTSAMGGLSYGPMLARFAQVFVLALGVIAALNHIGVAATVTTALLITVLATIGGVLVIGVGGGLIEPARQRWERILARGESELPRAREQWGRTDAAATADQPQRAYTTQGSGATAESRDRQQRDAATERRESTPGDPSVEQREPGRAERGR